MTQPRRPAALRRPRRPVRPRPASAREQVLLRRRYALIGLGAAVPVTLILAIITGSTFVLVLNIITGLALASYVAILLHIKQAQQR